MTSLIIKFFNKNKTESNLDNMQIDSALDTSALACLLNSILAKNANYIFYYDSERIITNLEFILKKYKLNTEEVLEIGYVDEDDIKFDHELYCNDTVVDLEYYNDELYYLEFNGIVYSKNKNFKYDLNKLIGIFSGSKLYGYTEYTIFDLLSNEEVYKTTTKIRNCYISKGNLKTIAICTFDSTICLDLDSIAQIDQIPYLKFDNNNYTISSIDGCDQILKNFMIKTEKGSRNIYVTDNIIYWLEGYNKVVSYDMKKKQRKTYSSEYAINSFICYNSKIIASTSNQKILQFSDNEVVEFESASRFLNNLALYRNNLDQYFIICSGQHEVVFLSAESMEEIKFFKVQGQINSLIIGDNMLHIANNQKIDGIIL